MGGIDKGMWPALLVALITWGGVFLYLVRLDRLTRELEKKVSRFEIEQGAGGSGKPHENGN